MKTVWTIVIIIVILILLYVVYRYMFKDKIIAQPAVMIPKPKINIPVVRPIVSGVLQSEPLSNQNTNTDYGNVQPNLMTILKSLGYEITTDTNGNVKALGYWDVGGVIKKFALRFPGQTNINGNLVDNDKWLEYQPLTAIQYNNKDDVKAHDYYTKLINFWGPTFFNIEAQRIIEASKKPIITIDCNSIAYKQKLTILSINLRQAESDWQVANYNLKQFNVQENREKEQRTKAKFDLAFAEYEEYNNLCKK